jgi:hypothetical protein
MKEFIKYYLLMIACYLSELLMFNLLISVSSMDYLGINFFLRCLMVLIFAKTTQKFIFPKNKNFYKTFYLLAAINPIISSFFLWFFGELIPFNINFIKILGDIITSIIFFFSLKILLNR